MLSRIKTHILRADMKLDDEHGKSIHHNGLTRLNG